MHWPYLGGIRIIRAIGAIGAMVCTACSGGPLNPAFDAGSPGMGGDDGASASDTSPILDAAVGGGDGGLWVNTGPCGDGEVGATFHGIAAYCQPAGTKGYYQCDELANRYLRDALQHPSLDNVVTSTPSCGGAASMSEYSVWGPRYRPTAGHKPVVGDILVFTKHVALVIDASAGSSIQIMQQNIHEPPVAMVDWDAASAFFTNGGAADYGDPQCWIHAEPAPPASAPTSPDCGCFDGDADYCGLSIVNHEWWYGCHANVVGAAASYDSLYSCAKGVFTRKQVCSSSLCVTPLLTPATGACH